VQGSGGRAAAAEGGRTPGPDAPRRTPGRPRGPAPVRAARCSWSVSSPFC